MPREGDPSGEAGRETLRRADLRALKLPAGDPEVSD